MGEPSVVLIDEAELVLDMFEYLTGRDPAQRPKGPAKQTLDNVEEVIDQTRDVNEKMALIIATDLTHMALGFVMGKANAQSIAEGKGEVAKKISRQQARQ